MTRSDFENETEPEPDTTSLAWEMAVWEVHRLRTELASTKMRIALYAHGHPDAQTLVDFLEEARKQLETDQVHALTDPVLRKMMPTTY